ncbi:hypothetical protein J6590_041562 [Homalodisca vitripennis]|nr:hypothetical protein J6590_041562 [Homalodisca vitripennis]
MFRVLYIHVCCKEVPESLHFFTCAERTEADVTAYRQGILPGVELEERGVSQTQRPSVCLYRLYPPSSVSVLAISCGQADKQKW